MIITRLLAITRITDHRHHPSDVIAGGLLGTLVAVVSVIFSSFSTNEKKINLFLVSLLNPLFQTSCIRFTGKNVYAILKKDESDFQHPKFHEQNFNFSFFLKLKTFIERINEENN